MKKRLAYLLAFALGVFFNAPAQAAISCSLITTNIFSVYDGLAATDNLNQSAFTLNCSRLSSDPTILDFIAFTNDGLYPNGLNNRAKHTASNNYVKYDFFTSSSYAVNWSKSGKCIVGSINFGSATSASQTPAFYSKIPAAQTGIPQGSYTDSVTVGVAYNRNSCQNGVAADVSSTFQLEISNVPACQIAVPLGNVNFSYTAFTPTAALANTTFQARCSTTLPYTLSINGTQAAGVYPGVVSGLMYELSIGQTTGWSPILPTSNQTGNGALQNYYINGRMAAGQAGTCATSACNASDPRTLTVTY